MDKRNGYSLETDLMPIIRGEVEIPNYEEMPIDRAVSYAAAWGNLHSARLRFPGAGQYDRPRAVVALETGQWGAPLHGTGIVLYEARYPDVAKAGRFAICKHEKTSTGSHDQSRRGYHPGFCSKCGLDMTVDSGD